MADVGSVLEIESGSLPALVIDIGAEVPGEARQLLGEPGHHTPPVTTVEDDSVFYCEDEIPQPEHGPSTFISVGAAWPAGFENVSQIQDLGADNSKQPVCGSVGLTEEGSVHPSASRVMDLENSIGKKVSRVPSPATVPTEESVSGPASSSSAAPGNEPSALQCTASAAVKGAWMHVEEKKEEILLTHTQTDAPTEAQSEQDGGTQERGESRNTHDQVGEMPWPPSGASADELDIFSLGNSNGVRAGLTISFNHLTHEKYGTVSYRQIRRGHTRRRIEEFESKMQL